ncbi:in type-1 retrotransposable element R1DM [Teratosphaeria destructans]|uniref:In type-1 retrotransposable element R1DM n=1 Tax=Teratosphaeria destructans TaxID=418781 RepID=A0A9W7W5A7_9PEZI|nr:in type-1 retrotransposable element R1DM [Teratosphaeria destructans]
MWILLEELGQGRTPKAVDALNSAIGLLLHHGNELPALRTMADRLRRVLDRVLEATLRSASPITAPGVPGLSKKLKRSVQGNKKWSAAQNESCESGLYIDSLDRSAYTRHNRDGTARWIENFRIEANDYVVCTDGSAKKSVYGTGDHGGASIALLEDGNWIGEFKALGPADSLTAELCGIDRGLGHGIENMGKKSIERLIIRTDCQAALSCLKKVLYYSKPRPSYLGIVDDIVQKLGILQSMNIMVALLWVKGHAICPGNYVADALAGHASDVSKKRTYLNLRWIKHSQCSWLDRVAMKAYNKSLSLAQDSNKRQRLNPGASESPSSLVPPVTPRFSWTPQLSAGSYSNPAAPSQLGASAGDPASGAVEFQVPSQPFTLKCPPSLPKGKSIDGGMFAFEGWLNKSKLQRTRIPAGVGKDVAEFESDD